MGMLEPVKTKVLTYSVIHLDDLVLHCITTPTNPLLMAVNTQIKLKRGVLTISQEQAPPFYPFHFSI